MTKFKPWTMKSVKIQDTLVGVKNSVFEDDILNRHGNTFIHSFYLHFILNTPPCFLPGQHSQSPHICGGWVQVWELGGSAQSPECFSGCISGNWRCVGFNWLLDTHSANAECFSHSHKLSHHLRIEYNIWFKHAINFEPHYYILCRISFDVPYTWTVSDQNIN